MARCCHLTIIANVALTQACPRKLCDKLVSRAEQCKKRRICTESTEKLACWSRLSKDCKEKSNTEQQFFETVITCACPEPHATVHITEEHSAYLNQLVQSIFIISKKNRTKWRWQPDTSTFLNEKCLTKLIRNI